MIVTQALGAGQRFTMHEQGDFFRIMGATFADLTVQFYLNGKEVSEANNVGAGYSEQFTRGEFDRVVITAVQAQTVQFAIRLGNIVNYDAPPVGNVQVINTAGAFTQAAATVTTTAANLLAANPSRRYLLVQNKDAAGIVYVNLSGAAATVANGIAIEPGGSLEIQGYAPTGAVSAIGSIASNPNVVVVGG